jgi:hypothetical protein
MNRHARLAPVLLLALTAPALAQTIAVTTGDDVVDFADPQRIENLPGPDGLVSLREAAAAANNTDGPQTIAFAIPQDRWWPVLPGRASCIIDYAIFLTAPDTTIDFTTQTALTGDTNPTGWEVGVYYAGPPSNISPFMVVTDRSTFIGMDYVGGNAFGAAIKLYGSDHRVISSTDGSVAIDRNAPDAPASTRNTIGGILPGEGNRLLYVHIGAGADGNTVIGNTLRFLTVSGDTLYGTCDNNRIGGPTPAERNVISGNARRGEEGFPIGTQVSIAHAVGTIFEGNYVGTTEDGMAMWPTLNGTTGIAVGHGAVGTLIRNNLVSGIARTGSNHYEGQRFGTAIVISEGTDDTRLVGNRIGTTADGEGVIVNVSGIFVEQPTVHALPLTGLLLGTSSPGEGNIITGSERFGVAILSTVAGVRISGNSIHSNGQLGIDLFSNVGGLTPNDPADADTGGNNLQNFPVVESAAAAADAVRVRGSLASVPNETFVIEFFANSVCDPSGFGEGEIFLGAVPATTDASGAADFDSTLPNPLGPGSFITATASRDATSDTSEFSACAPITDTLCAADFNHNDILDSQDFFDFLAAFFAHDADFNADGATNSQDFFDFLTSFFAGC